MILGSEPRRRVCRRRRQCAACDANIRRLRGRSSISQPASQTSSSAVACMRESPNDHQRPRAITRRRVRRIAARRHRPDLATSIRGRTIQDWNYSPPPWSPGSPLTPSRHVLQRSRSSLPHHQPEHERHRSGARRTRRGSTDSPWPGPCRTPPGNRKGSRAAAIGECGGHAAGRQPCQESAGRRMGHAEEAAGEVWHPRLATCRRQHPDELTARTTQASVRARPAGTTAATL